MNSVEELKAAPYGEELDKIEKELFDFDRLIIRQLLGIDDEEVALKTKGMVFSPEAGGVPVGDTARLEDIRGKVRNDDGSVTYYSAVVGVTASIMMVDRSCPTYCPLRLKVTVGWEGGNPGYYGVAATLGEIGFSYRNAKAIKRLKTKPSRMETNWGRRILNELALWNQS